jgi:hypothetical protein
LFELKLPLIISLSIGHKADPSYGLSSKPLLFSSHLLGFEYSYCLKFKLRKKIQNNVESLISNKV